MAQEACEFVDPGNDLLVQRAPFTYVTNPHFRCDGGVEIWADSAVVNSSQSVSLLIGGVRYLDGLRELSASEARYFYDVARLQAQGRVRVTNFEDGSTVENGDLVYLRQTDFRDVEEMTVTTGADGIRPRATVFPRRAEPAPADSVAPPVPPVDAEPTDDVPTPDAPTDFAPDTTMAAAPVPDTATAVDVSREPVETAGPDVEEPAEPEEYVIVADRIFFRGDSYFNALGTVEIERDSLFAYADSAEYTGDEGTLVLDGSARVVGSSYDLVGRTVTLRSEADGSDEVRALRDAELTGEDLRVTAPQIVLHLLGGELQRMVAVPLTPPTDTAAVRQGGGTAAGAAAAGTSARDSAAADSALAVRPYAVSEDIQLTGDSLDLAAPAGVLERIFAAGNARSVSAGRPELNVEALPEMARRDWIDADTIEVLLVPAPTDSVGADSTDDYRVERIIARVGARSLYRLVPSDSSAVVGVDPPAVSYMVADRITIFMADGQAERVESVGQVTGWHLEPLARTAEETSEDAPPGSPEADSQPGPATSPDVPPGPVPPDGGDARPPGA